MTQSKPTKSGFSILDRVEWLGNKLPEPALIFVVLAVMVIIASGIGAAVGWQVQPVQLAQAVEPVVDAEGRPVLDAQGKPVTKPKVDAHGHAVREIKPVGDPLTPKSLMTGEGVYWMLSSMVRNFTTLPALGLVFVAMLGIGLAEKFGMFSALMRALALATPSRLLTPVVVFIGANASVASDAGYIVLPPLAAALYLAVGRSPIAGLAAAFAGVSGGFGGGWFPTAADGFLAGTASGAARIIDPTYPDVNPLHNLYFKGLSSILIMLAGWFVTDRIIEPRMKRQAHLDSADVSAIKDMALTRQEKRGLVWAGLAAAAVFGLFAAMVFMPGAPLEGKGVPALATGQAPASVTFKVVDKPAFDAYTADKRLYSEKARVDRATGETIDPGYFVVQGGGAPAMQERPSHKWSQVIVPLIFFIFLIPGCAYGISTGTLRGQKDFIEAIYYGIRSIVPVLTISFFMGQFVNYFSYTGLDRMLAFAGGSLLVQADLPIPLLIVMFVLLVIAGDFVMSGMLSKFGVMAPIFIPMFMMVGASPELTTAAYRIGDSVVNVITPLNSYLLIILVVLQKYRKDAGLGTLIALMLPYSVVFFVLWTGFLLAWYFTGQPLGVGAPLLYAPAH